VNLQLAVSKSMMFPLPKNINGIWMSLDQPSIWTFLQLEGEQIQIGVAGTVVRGQVNRHGSVLTIHLEGAKPLVAYASLQSQVLELEFVTHRLHFALEEPLLLEND
jgi:hypothetical protein